MQNQAISMQIDLLSDFRTMDMKPKLASTVLTTLLYTQGLLGFAGLTTVILKDWAKPEPVLVVGLDNTAPPVAR